MAGARMLTDGKKEVMGAGEEEVRCRPKRPEEAVLADEIAMNQLEEEAGEVDMRVEEAEAEVGVLHRESEALGKGVRSGIEERAGPGDNAAGSVGEVPSVYPRAMHRHSV
jgi:hypothetical protein